MQIEELIQLIRTCNLAQVRSYLQSLRNEKTVESEFVIGVVRAFYEEVAKEPK